MKAILKFFRSFWYCKIKSSHKYKVLHQKDKLNRKHRGFLFCRCANCGKRQYIKIHGQKLLKYE